MRVCGDPEWGKVQADELYRGPDSQKVVRDFPVVVEYARRIHERYFPDYEIWAE